MNVLLYAPEYRPNLSNMIRTTEFYGLKKIYIYDQNGLMHPPSNKVSRAEMNHMARVWTAGAMEYIEIQQVDDVSEFLGKYPGRSIATVVSEKGVDLNDFAFETDDLVIMGPEKEGLPENFVLLCDQSLFIQNLGVTDCLNVSVTLGIVLNEGLKQLGS